MPVSVNESRGNPFVGAVDDLCTGGSGQVLADLANDASLDEDVGLVRASLVLLGVGRDDSALQ